MKLLTVILTIVVTVLSILPCCSTESCAGEEVQTEQQAADTHAPENEACSPFYSCSSCIGFTLTAASLEESLPSILEVSSAFDHPPAFLSRFYHSIWQPPKIS